MALANESVVPASRDYVASSLHMFAFISFFSLQPKDKPVPNATLQVTGAVGWRREGLAYKKNEVSVEFLFSVYVDLLGCAEVMIICILSNAGVSGYCGKCKPSDVL